MTIKQHLVTSGTADDSAESTATANAAKAPTCERKYKIAQVAATGPKHTFEVDDRPSIRNLGLAGPRRAREGRGGATASLNSLRFLIRYPGLSALQSVVPARTKGRPPAYPDRPGRHDVKQTDRRSMAAR